jgi:hypothetical protein
MANRQAILGAAMLIAAFPIKTYSNAYFTNLDARTSFISTMLFYSFIILGAGLLFYQFMVWRVTKIRAEREKDERARE